MKLSLSLSASSPLHAKPCGLHRTIVLFALVLLAIVTLNRPAVVSGDLVVLVSSIHNWIVAYTVYLHLWICLGYKRDIHRK
jgi:hypothetical protein